MQADIFSKRSGIERNSKPFWDQIDEREKAEVTKVGDQQDGIYGECPPMPIFLFGHRGIPGQFYNGRLLAGARVRQKPHCMWSPRSNAE